MSDAPILVSAHVAEVLSGARWEAVASGRRAAVWRCTFSDGRPTVAVKAASSEGTPSAAGRAEAEALLRDEAAVLGWMAEPFAELGIAVPAVVAGPSPDDRAPALVTTWLDGEPDLRFLGSATLAAESFGRALATLHGASRHVDLERCPADDSLTAHLERIDRRIAAGLVDASRFEDVFARYAPDELAERLHKLADVAVEPGPDDRVFLHGDLCASNLLVDPNSGTPLGLVDWPFAGVGDRHLDLAITARSLVRNFGGECLPSFFAAYGDFDPDPIRLEVYALAEELN